MRRPRSRHLFFALFFCAYAAFLIIELPKYGLTFDTPYEFPRAAAYVERLLSGRVSPLETPEDRRPRWDVLTWDAARSSLTLSSNGCLPSLIAALSGWVLFQRLGLLEAIDAYHLGLTVLWLACLWGFHSRVRRLHGPQVALLAAVLLSLAPQIVGHAHNNMKDIPATGFGALAILDVAIAAVENRPRRLYLAALFFGCALASKFSATVVLVPGGVILGLWFRPGGRWPRLPRAYWVPLLTGPFVVLAVIVGHWPYLWALPPELWERLAALRAIIAVRVHDHIRISHYPVAMVLYTTPLPVLAFAVLSFATRVPWQRADRRTRFLFWCYAAWLAAILLSYSVSRVQLFDGMRHFLHVWPPLALLAAFGLEQWGTRIGVALQLSPRSARLAAGAGLAALLATLVYPLVLYHPYEVTYFNALAGGLRGARRLDFGRAVDDFEPRDYWGSSLREAVEWANENLPRGAYVSFGVPPLVGEFYVLREDLQRVDYDPATRHTPHYALFICRPRWYKELETEAVERGELVHETAIQGVPLSVVYRLP